MPPFIDLTGEQFGRWIVIKRQGTARTGQPLWFCCCECGTKGLVTGQNLREGISRSCGCLNRDVHREQCIKRNTKHGHKSRKSPSKTYVVWVNLKRRIPSGYKWQPPVCNRWQESFENFLADMGEAPSPKHTIDRIDNSGGYSPMNCRWVTMKEQQNNRDNNRRLSYNGKTMTVAEWADLTGINPSTLSKRVNRLGWSAEKALTKAVQIHHRK